MKNRISYKRLSKIIKDRESKKIENNLSLIFSQFSKEQRSQLEKIIYK